jgi:hypothetical protein
MLPLDRDTAPYLNCISLIGHAITCPHRVLHQLQHSTAQHSTEQGIALPVAVRHKAAQHAGEAAPSTSHRSDVVTHTRHTSMAIAYRG